MARKRRVLDEDGLDRVEYFDQDTPLDEYPDSYRNGFGGFEWTIAEIEAWAKAVVAAEPVSIPMRGSLQLGAYAWRIMTTIARLRKMLGKSAKLEGVILEALRVGYDWGQIRRRNLTRAGLKSHTDKRKAGRRSGKARRKPHTLDRRKIQVLARTIRREHPYNRRQYSTRKLAQTIALRHKPRLSTEEIRGHLRTLKIR